MPPALVSFCVVVPMYNEQVNAERCVRAISAVLDTLPNPSRLVVIDDGSRDGTRAIVERLEEGGHPRLRLLAHPANAGYGAALRTGIEHAAGEGFDYVLFMDSDLTNDPKYIPRFVERMQAGADVIKASRYVAGGGVLGVPRYRVVISRAGNAVARALYGLPLSDCTNGFRAVRTSLLRRMAFRETGFAIIMEELFYAKALACSFAEVPNTLTNRSSDARPTSFSYRPAMFLRYLKYPVKARLGLRPLAGDERT